MGSETRAFIRRLQESINETFDALVGLTDEQLDAACSHPCGQAGEVRTIRQLIANDIDHERMHAGQILGLRHDLGVIQTGRARLLSEWLRERAALIGSLAGLPDEALDRRPAPEQWSIREVVEHTLYWERDSIQAGLRDLDGGEAWRPDAALTYGGPVPATRQPAI